MVLKFKDRTENPRKKVLVYGMDGSGKSTFAANYCKDNGLNPVCIDIDDTNFTDIPILDLSFSSDVQTYQTMKKIIAEISKSEFDTLILDGVTSLLEMLTSKAKGQAKYSDRAMRWNDILFEIEKTKMNIIFVGQIDMEMMFNEDYQPSKAVIKVNSMVNEKYKTIRDDKGNYSYETMKCRTFDELEAGMKIKKDDPKPAEPKQEDNVDDIFNDFNDIATSIHAENKDLTSAKQELFQLMQDGIITEMNCPKILEILEELYK